MVTDLSKGQSTNIEQQALDSIISKNDFVTSHRLINHKPKNELSSPINLQLITFNENHYSDSLFSLFDIKTPPNFENMLIPRKASFLAGRLAVITAFHDISISPQNIQSGSHKQPLWPKHIIGSISHSTQCSIATVERSNSDPGETHSVGIDIQHIINTSEIEDIQNIVLTENETKYLNLSTGDWSRNHLFSLLFSAKESFFKAIFPSINQYINFTDVSVTKLDLERQTLSVTFESSFENSIEKSLRDRIDLEKEYELSFELIDVGTPNIFTYCRI